MSREGRETCGAGCGDDGAAARWAGEGGTEMASDDGGDALGVMKGGHGGRAFRNEEKVEWGLLQGRLADASWQFLRRRKRYTSVGLDA